MVLVFSDLYECQQFCRLPVVVLKRCKEKRVPAAFVLNNLGGSATVELKRKSSPNWARGISFSSTAVQE